jgi:hypothetical protein
VDGGGSVLIFGRLLRFWVVHCGPLGSLQFRLLQFYNHCVGGFWVSFFLVLVRCLFSSFFLFSFVVSAGSDWGSSCSVQVTSISFSGFCSVSATTASLAVVVVAFCGGFMFVLFMFILYCFVSLYFFRFYQRLGGSIWIRKPDRVWFY